MLHIPDLKTNPTLSVPKPVKFQLALDLEKCLCKGSSTAREAAREKESDTTTLKPDTFTAFHSSPLTQTQCIPSCQESLILQSSELRTNLNFTLVCSVWVALDQRGSLQSLPTPTIL